MTREEAETLVEVRQIGEQGRRSRARERERAGARQVVVPSSPSSALWKSSQEEAPFVPRFPRFRALRILAGCA